MSHSGCTLVRHYQPHFVIYKMSHSLLCIICILLFLHRVAVMEFCPYLFRLIFAAVLQAHTRTFNCPLSRTTRVSWYQKGKTNLDFTEARDSEWQQHQLGRMQVCTSLQTDNHASTPPLSFLQAGCPSCRPTNSVKAWKAVSTESGDR